jgi:phytoene dehydrogenase-like protein
MQNPDVIVVGAGHNGLVAANYLARAGLAVLVLERRDIVGGACVTEEVFPGVRVSTGAYIVSLLAPQVIEELELRSRGLDMYLRDVACFAPLPEGNYVMLYHDEKRNLQEIARHNPHDAEAYVRFQSYLDRIEKRLSPWWMRDAPSMEELARVFSGREGEWQMRDLLFSSVGELMDEYFESSAIKAVIGVDGVIGSFAGPRTPGTSFVLINHSLGQALGSRGAWGHVKGGMGSITQALAEQARAHGVEIRTGAPVGSIDVENGQVEGVTLADGEQIKARTVMSCADPRTTFLRLVSREHLSANFVTRLEQFPMRGFGMKMHLLLSELPDFEALPGKEAAPHHGGVLLIAPTLDYMHQAYGDGRVGRFSTHPIIEGVIPTIDDDSLAPAGQHVMSLWVQFAPYHLAEGNWVEEGARCGDRVVEVLSRYAPNLPKAIIDRHIMTPLDIEDRFGMAWGHAHHGEMRPGYSLSFRPVPGWSRYRSPVSGLYLCGSGAHPGGGVSGMPGRNAAYALLDDLDDEDVSST